MTPEQRAKEALIDAQEHLSGEHPNTTYCVDLSGETIAYLLSLIERDRWIPVTERPKKSGYYLCSDNDGVRYIAFWEDAWRPAFVFELDGYPLYWRPLPPAPEQEKL